MKKYFTLAIIALAFYSCDDAIDKNTTEGSDDPNKTPETFIEILQSKTWKLTAYSDNILGDYFAKDFSNSGGGESNGECEVLYIDKAYNWVSYDANFTANKLSAEHSYELTAFVSVDFNNCKALFEESNETTKINSNYTYSEAENTLAVNFGNVFELNISTDAVDNFIDLTYTIKSFSTASIVLEASGHIEGYDFTRKITLK